MQYQHLHSILESLSGSDTKCYKVFGRKTENNKKMYRASVSLLYCFKLSLYKWVTTTKCRKIGTNITGSLTIAELLKIIYSTKLPTANQTLE